jgi:SAM-dependent methyltransferase
LAVIPDRPARPERLASTRRGARVEVRRVQRGLELRIEGTLASAYRPGRSLTGVVWWALAAPVLLVRRPRPRVLLLGLAAGSVAHALRALDPDSEIVGVEIDRNVVRAARRHFGLDELAIEVVVDDALSYLRRERRRFDVVIEDLFVGPSRTVHKPDWLLGEGYRLIGRRLRADGIVVSNTIHETPAVVQACRRLRGGRGRSMLTLDVASHWNQIVVSGGTLPAARSVRRTLLASRPLRRVVRRLSVRTVPAGRAVGIATLTADPTARRLAPP